MHCCASVFEGQAGKSVALKQKKRANVTSRMVSNSTRVAWQLKSILRGAGSLYTCYSVSTTCSKLQQIAHTHTQCQQT